MRQRFQYRLDVPLIAYIMTRGKWKKRGIAGTLLKASLATLKNSGYPEVRAVITDGNIPSELIFDRAGFERVDPGDKR